MLQIENMTRNTMLMKRGRMADNFLTKFRGLMGVRQLHEGEGLLITHCNSVHTHFMFMPIDIIYVDKNHRIVDLEAEMKTWRIGRTRRNADYVIELPPGVIAHTRCAVGDELRLQKG